jgi:hypothetical protein
VSARTVRFLLRCYPRAWRERYGEELETLLAQMRTDGVATHRAQMDIVRAGVAERLLSSGLAGDGAPPKTQATSGSLLVLCAWAMFVVGGVLVQRFSEHWRQFTPSSARALPTGAFQTLTIAAFAGSGMVIAGGACALPRVLDYLRAGGWPEVRHRVLSASVASLLAFAAGTGLVLWAHRLDAYQRNGHDSLYGLAFIAVALLATAALAAWTAAIVATARRTMLPATLLKVEVGVAAAVSLTMLVMSAATGTWFLAMAIRAPWALREHARVSGASGLDAPLVAALALMAIASMLAGVGTFRALRAVPRLTAS